MDRPTTLRETVAVDCTFEDDGQVTVRKFAWHGIEMMVTALGRQWTEEVAGGVRRCVLVMSAGYGTFELCLEPADMRWHARCISRSEWLV